VIERASGVPFPRFARERIFAPLGMTSTLLFDDHGLVVPHRATGYGPRRGGGFRVAMSDFEQLGDGAVQTSVEDLVRWDANFYAKQVGGEALHAFLHATGTLADGSSIEYARGLFVDTFRGLARVSHGGAWAGYRAQLMRFPEQKTAIVCLANLNAMDPNALCEQVAEVVLAGELKSER
jgi:CubicO group peptidase (beta-lactamase class C family)